MTTTPGPDDADLITRLTSDITQHAQQIRAVDGLAALATARAQRRGRRRVTVAGVLATAAVIVPISIVSANRDTGTYPAVISPTTAATSIDQTASSREATWRQIRVTVPSDWAGAPDCPAGSTPIGPSTVRSLESLREPKGCRSVDFPLLGAVFFNAGLYDSLYSPGEMHEQPSLTAGLPDTWFGYNVVRAPNARGLSTDLGVTVTTLDRATGQAVLDSLRIVANAPTGPRDPSTALPGSRWDPKDNVPGDLTASIRFFANGTWHGSDGCNTQEGDYQLVGDLLLLTPTTGSTEIGCRNISPLTTLDNMHIRLTANGNSFTAFNEANETRIDYQRTSD